MRILFAGSPFIAVPSLKALVKSKSVNFELAGVLTNPDAPRGRKSALIPSEIAQAAGELLLEAKFAVFKPEKLDAKAREEISLIKPDILVSFAYGRIFGPKFLDLFPLGGINIHPSLLPKYRGPSPLQAAIINRDAVTGVSIQKLAPKMDSGDILAVKELQLTGQETTSSLGEIAGQTAAFMLPEVLDKIACKTASSSPQNHNEASYCRLIKKEDSDINWNQSAAEIEAKIRAFTPWPLSKTIHNGRELFILKAVVLEGGRDDVPRGQVLGIDKKNGILVQTGKGILCVTELQYQAKKALHWRDFLNGARDFADEKNNPTMLG